MSEPEARLLVWARSKWLRGGNRNLADTVIAVIVPQRHALRLARDLDAYGHRQLEAALRDGIAEVAGDFDPERRVVAGHGVTILYASGYRREIRVDRG